MDRGVAGVACVVLGGCALGCASSTQPAVSAAVRDLNGIECPDENVRILETRDADDDTVYVVDACGRNQRQSATDSLIAVANEERISIEQVERAIVILRGCRVMLDSDLARLYGVPVKRLNEQVRRNRARFPADFMLQLTPDEARRLRSQIATLEAQPREMIGLASRGRHAKYAPYAFTEQGVAMLSSVLRSPRAVPRGA